MTQELPAPPGVSSPAPEASPPASAPEHPKPTQASVRPAAKAPAQAPAQAPAAPEPAPEPPVPAKIYHVRVKVLRQITNAELGVHMVGSEPTLRLTEARAKRLADNSVIQVLSMTSPS